LYYFVMNADEQIYMRYGGRDAASATSYLNLRSLEQALEEGLRMHAAGDVPTTERPPPLFPTDIPLLRKRTLARGDCVECHLIADYQNIQKELDGDLDRLRDMFRSPDIKKIGIILDVPAGLLVKEAQGAAAEAGLRGSDRLTHINGTRVRTFGDLQYFYDRVPRDAKRITLGIVREEAPATLEVQLPARWWLTELAFRHWTVEPVTFFKTQPLSNERKVELGLPVAGFAGEVIEKERFFKFSSPALQLGDIVFGVEDVLEDELANSPELHIKLRHPAGSQLKIDVLRDNERFVAKLTTERQNFRKVEP
jgi:hypothetical protein